MNHSINTNIISADVSRALQEDIGTGDITASLIPEKTINAVIVSRDNATLSGILWVNEVFKQLSSTIVIDWFAADGDRIRKNTELCQLTGPAQLLLTGERTALNFLQTLSGTATIAQAYADAVSGINVQILDTRKTLPGLRTAQKYAVRCGNCNNHRFGLADGMLIKENHILSAGSISSAITHAKKIAAELPVEIEVENLAEFEQALTAEADIILLDNFAIADLKKAVSLSKGRALLEASGGITLANIRDIAATGVDRISIGTLTKHIQAIDLSMRFI